MNNKNKNVNPKKNYIKYYIIYLISINIFFYIGFKVFWNFRKINNFSPYSPEITEIKINNGNFAKIGIISDIQLKSKFFSSNSQNYENNLKRALKYFKKHNIDLIIIAGDITGSGNTKNFFLFNKIFYSVYDYNRTSPIVLSLMGNHDYMDRKYKIIENQQKFFIYMKSYPYSHYIINNFNFIFWSNDNYYHDEPGVNNDSWIKSSLEIARRKKYKEGDPIFVISHMHPKNTVYGSNGIWGSTVIYNTLKDYPEVISISGHSHYSLRNIKSIWQGNFTAINTQSLSYVDLDEYFQNNKNVHSDSKESDSMGLIAYLNESNIIFHRIEFATEEVLEEKWIINFPINTSNFIYNFEKRNKKIIPIFNDTNEIKIEKTNKNKNYIIFNSAYHEDYVYNYKIKIKNKTINEEYLYYSDYYKNKKKRKEIIRYELPHNISSGVYNVEIYAIDSFNNTSLPKKGIIHL